MNNGESTAKGFLLGACASALVLALVIVIIANIQRDLGVRQAQQEAVKAGVAEYKPGDEGEPVFTWKVP